jgi:CDP-diacylglycerol--serine O-phosphatidyltransferase
MDLTQQLFTKKNTILTVLLVNIKKQIPNTLTSLNLLSGLIGILALFNGQYTIATYCIIASLIADFLDGFAARLLKVSSDIGKELDSLADVISFGLLPSCMMVYLLCSAYAQIPLAVLSQTLNWDFYLNHPFILVAFLLAIFSAIRLAKFNIDTRQSDRFIGVPTPTNAMLVASFLYILNQNDSNSLLLPIVQNFYFLIAYSLLMSYLLVSELPLIALKFKSFQWSPNKLRYVLIVGSLLLIVLLKIESIFFIFLLYLCVSVYENLFMKEGTKS